MNGSRDPWSELDAIFDRFAEEFRLRHRWGDKPEVAEYLNRFGQYGGDLEHRLQEIHEAEGDSTGIDNESATLQHATGIQRLPGMQVRCPHCHEPVVVRQDDPLTAIECSSCGTTFKLISYNETLSFRPRWIERLGRFELLEQAGVGAFGTVWKARDTQLRRTVAIKVPRRNDLEPHEQDYFFREARSAAQLRHEGIVRVYEAGSEPETGTLFIVSDYVDGLTLDDWMTGQQPTSREAVELCRQIARALQHAHEHGVIHRDLKPSNIMLDRDSIPHVMDFGLALRQAEVTVTATGQVLGTPAYMSPEQARGDSHQADARSDIYALGVILFELLTGERPFRGNTRMLLHQVLTEEPPSPRKFRADLSRDLETVCLKCMEKEPDRRYQSARELADELERLLRGEPVLARPVGKLQRAWRWCRRNSVLAGLSSAAVLLLAAVTVATFAAYVNASTALAAEQGRTEAVAARDEAIEAQKKAEKAILAEKKAKEEAIAAQKQAIAAANRADEARKQRDIAEASHVQTLDTLENLDADFRQLVKQLQAEKRDRLATEKLLQKARAELKKLKEQSGTTE